MADITLNYDDSMLLLKSTTTDPSARIIAACAVAFFERERHADDAIGEARAAALKLLHMGSSAIYRNGEED